MQAMGPNGSTKQALGLILLGSVLSTAMSASCVDAKTVTLRFWGRWWRSAMPIAYDNLVAGTKAYERSHPNVKIEYVNNNGEDLQGLLTLAAAGIVPDVMHLYQPWVFGCAARGLIESYTADFANRMRPQFYPVTTQALTSNGRLFAVPTENQVMGLVYNKKVLSEAGIGSLPGTWEQLATLGAKLTVKQANGRFKRQGFSLEFEEWSLPAQFRAMLQAYGGKFMGKGGPAFDSSEGLAVADDMKTWLVDKQIASLDYREAMAQGKVGFAVGYPWWVLIYDPLLKGKFQETLGVTDVPAGPAGRGTYHYSWGLSVAKSSKHKKEAMDFIEFMTTRSASPSSATYMGEGCSQIGDLPSFKGDSGKGGFAKLAWWTGGFTPGLDWAVPTDGLAMQEQIDKAVFEELYPALTSGKREPASALSRARQRVELLLKRGR